MCTKGTLLISLICVDNFVIMIIDHRLGQIADEVFKKGTFICPYTPEVDKLAHYLVC